MKRSQAAGLLVGPAGTIARRLTWATSFGARRRGVRGRPMRPDEAMIIRPCRQVHTIGVPQPIDAVFCDDEMRVLHVQTLEPRRLSRRVSGASLCIELLGGRAEACGVVPGVQLAVEESS